VLSAETYSLDSASNLSSKTVDKLTTSYTDDNANQLLTESSSGFSASYSYDANGNRSSQVQNGTTYNGSDCVLFREFGSDDFGAIEHTM